MMVTRIMMRFVVRVVSKCHSSSDENFFSSFLFVLEYGFVSDYLCKLSEVYIRDVMWYMKIT